MTVKQAALRMIKHLPDDASLEDIMYELYFRQRVDRGLRELARGKTVSHTDVKRSLAKWPSVRWTVGARADLREVVECISQDSVTYAAALAERIVTNIGRLRRHPRLGRVVPEYKDRTIRELIVGNYRELCIEFMGGELESLPLSMAAATSCGDSRAVRGTCRNISSNPTSRASSA